MEGRRGEDGGVGGVRMVGRRGEGEERMEREGRMEGGEERMKGR